MKMFYGKTPIKSLNIKHYEMDTNSCDMIASDLQAGKTAVARGKKITGTGKSFEFAYYGAMETNLSRIVPCDINVIEIASSDYPIQLNIALSDMKNIDFSINQNVGSVIIDGVSYIITVQMNNGELVVSCDKTITLQLFYGKDNYV